MIPMPSDWSEDPSHGRTPRARPQIKYRAQQCPFLHTAVWAILTKQQDGHWNIVNCLDKRSACFEQACAFTRDGGRWPFEVGPGDHRPTEGG